MGSLSKFSGASGPVASLVRGGSQFAMSNLVGAANAVSAASGAMTANTLKTALSVTGRGRVNWLGAYSADATARTIRIKVTVDGVAVTDQTVATSTAGHGLCAIGGGTGGNLTSNPSMTFQPVDFRTSLLVEISSTLTETDKMNTAWNYEVWA